VFNDIGLIGLLKRGLCQDEADRTVLIVGLLNNQLEAAGTIDEERDLLLSGCRNVYFDGPIVQAAGAVDQIASPLIRVWLHERRAPSTEVDTNCVTGDDSSQNP